MVGKRSCSLNYRLPVGGRTLDTMDILGIERMSGDLTVAGHEGSRDFQSVDPCTKKAPNEYVGGKTETRDGD